MMSTTQLEELLAGQPQDDPEEIVEINTDARPRALQVALLVPSARRPPRAGRRRSGWCDYRSRVRRTPWRGSSSADRPISRRALGFPLASPGSHRRGGDPEWRSDSGSGSQQHAA